MAAWVADRAKRASAVVMDPYTGEIYARRPIRRTTPTTTRRSRQATRRASSTRSCRRVYEPGSVFKMMTAAAALEAGTVTPTTRIKDVGTLRLDKGKTKIDDADRKGMGWMTFQDGVAYSRNVVAAKVALGLGKTTRESSAILHDMWIRLGYGQPTGIDVAGEVGGIAHDPGIDAMARDRPRQRRIRSGRRGHADPAGATAYAALMNGGTMVQPHVVKAVGDHDMPAAPTTKVIDTGAVGDAARDDAPRHHRGPVLPRPDARPRLRRRRQDGHRPDLGSEGEPRPRCLEDQPVQLLVRRLHRAADGRSRSRRRRSGSRRARRRSSRSATSRCRSCRSSCSVGSRPMRITTPDLLPDRRSTRRRPGPVTAACATLAAVTDVDASTPVPGQSPAPALTADDLVRLTGGRLLARSDRPIRGAAVDSRLVQPGQLFVALPGERTDGHAFARRGDRGWRGGADRRPPDRRCRRRSVTSRSFASPTRLPRSGPSRPAGGVGSIRSSSGVTGSIAKTSTKEAVASGPRDPLSDPPQRGQPQQRDRPAADAPAARPRARGGRARDGDVRRRRDRRAGPDRPAADRGRHRGPAGPPVADRVARGDRGGQGRAARGAATRRHGRPQRGRPDRPSDGASLGGAQPHLRLRGRRRCRRGGRRVGRSRTACASSCAPRARDGR